MAQVSEPLPATGRPSQGEGDALQYTHHQGKYFAYWLSLGDRGEDAVARTLAASRVDMNPHQVDAALFALRSPVAEGVLLADEVGLGKTVEAGLVIAQYWAMDKRRILLVVPATLRKQWHQELADKFQLPAEIVEAKSFRQSDERGEFNPLDRSDAIVICSYEFAARRRDALAAVQWDLAVLDEAHKIRSLHKGAEAKQATALSEALRERKKILLTATPFQNSLMELYGLATFISDGFFGSKKSFQLQYTGARASEERLHELRQRLQPMCHRTLRRQVQMEGGINFTQRHSMTQDFALADEERMLYERVSEYLQNETALGIPAGSRHLVTLVMRKILASSSAAIADTLGKFIERMQRDLPVDEDALADYEAVSDYDAGYEDDAEPDLAEGDANRLHTVGARSQSRTMREEIALLEECRSLALSIGEDRKARALLDALGRAFDLTEKLGGPRKAVVFTESRRTQAYLRDLLERNGYAGRTVLLNGNNDDADSKALYAEWRRRHAGSAIVSGSRSADMKSAIVEAFRDQRDILIATEAGGEGINLQFCSLLINYDLPWNPQRVEQRIGRIHRYGQKHDVVVLNFVNRDNRADQLVYELLDKKFKLFDGVFGASDEILGAIESGIGFEQRINEIYQRCRSPAEIEAQFAQLRQQLDAHISDRERNARRLLLENFDEDVVAKLRMRRENMNNSLDLRERHFRRMIAAERPESRFDRDLVVLDDVRYALRWPPAERSNVALLRPDQGLGRALCESARGRETPPGVLRLRYSSLDGGAQLSDVRAYIGRGGRLRVAAVEVHCAAQPLRRLVCVAECEDGALLSEQAAERLLQLQGSFEPTPRVAEFRVWPAFDAAVAQVGAAARARNAAWFQEESDRLERWAEDQRIGLKQEMDELAGQIREAKRRLRDLEALEDKVRQKREIKRLEQRRDDVVLAFHERRKEIEKREDSMLDHIEALLALGQPQVEHLFDVEWRLED